MIHLIDDDKQRQQTRYSGYIDLKAEEANGNLVLHNSLPVNFESELKGAIALLIHDSITPDGLKMDLVNWAENQEIKVVLFSNKFQTQDVNRESGSLMSDTVYQNLRVFLGHHQISEEINIKILAFGGSYQIEEFTKLRDEILRLYSDFGIDEAIELDLNVRVKLSAALDVLDEQVVLNDLMQLQENNSLTRDRLQSTFNQILLKARS